MLVSDREIFSFSEKERKRYRRFFVDRDPPFSFIFFFFFFFCVFNQLSPHCNKTLCYNTMFASTSGGALFPRSICILFPFVDFYLVDDLFSVFLTKRRIRVCHRLVITPHLSKPIQSIPRRSPKLGRRPKFYNETTGFYYRK